MTTYAQLLARRYEDDLMSMRGALSANIVEGSRRMQMLVSDLLAFSQAQGGQLVLRPTDMAQVLEAALASLRSSIDDTGAAITHDALPMMTVDAARMSQVFQNLVGNAIKYRKPDESRRIHVSARRENERCWIFSVQDNGLGFDNSYAEQIFGMFKRLHGRDIAALALVSRSAGRSLNHTAVRSGRRPRRASGQRSRSCSRIAGTPDSDLARLP